MREGVSGTPGSLPSWLASLRLECGLARVRLISVSMTDRFTLAADTAGVNHFGGLSFVD
jgi:hypothetical protein